MSAADHPHQNRLASETSPYLLQHAQNPVDWYPWGREALDRAKEEDKPILLSIGYAACHWCHVMERESFEDEATAALMNEHFVCVKVDREERPDLDEIYMQATVAMSGSGGWPMTVFLTPDGHEPFFAGTYFPPKDTHGRPGFTTLLRRIAQLWEAERDTLKTQGREIASELRTRSKAALPAAVGESGIDAAVEQLAQAFDSEHGGFGKAPKFPPATALSLLLRHHRRTGDEASVAMVRVTLDGMAKGGMYDHLGGGFARYSTDDEWLVPHFEKMLYDNALLAKVYVHAFQVMGDPEDERVARETLDYVLREMTRDDGAFYSATDADSEGVEGKFFVWTPDEVEAILPPEHAAAFCAYYDVTPQGNWEGHSILRTLRSPAEVAADLELTESALRDRLSAAKVKMYAARQERVPPLLDDKILCAWNALMIAAMAEGGRAFDEPRYRDAAEKAADFLWDAMRRSDGGLFRTTRGDKTHLDAYLEDYAYLTDALVDVYEATGAVRHLERAAALAERMIADFHDGEGGGFFSTAANHESLLVRTRDGQDGAIPAANALAATALVRLSWHLDRDEWRTIAVDALRAHGKLIERAPRAFCASLCVADMVLEGPVEAVIVGDRDGRAPLAAEVGRHYLPNRVIVHVDPSGEPPPAPEALLAGKGQVEGEPALYVCRDFACKRPVTAPDDVAAVLADARSSAVEGRDRRLGERLAGRATELGTTRYAKRHAEVFGEHGVTKVSDLTAGRIAFGGYRVDDAQSAHREALVEALKGGANLVDTSTNYTDGGSERLVGSVVAELVAAGELARDEVIVVSKIGYVQGQNLDVARRRIDAGDPFDEMVEYADGCWHCIHPDWLDDQLTRSLDRLGMDHLDVCLLHNPEYFLSDATKRGEVTDEVRDEFYDRVERAFAWLETQVEAGRIGAYGVSSNTVAQPASDPEATDLSRFVAVAKSAGGDEHHFAVLQLPLNLMESEAAIVGDPTVLERAHEAGLAVLVNRPLNAIVDGTLLRLADPPDVGEVDASYAEALDEVAELERQFAGSIAPTLEGLSIPPEALFRFTDELRKLDGQLESLGQWEQIARGQVIPVVSRAIQAVERAIAGAARNPWMEWRSAYIRHTELALGALRAQTAKAAGARVETIRDAVDPLVPLAKQQQSVSRKALWTLLSTPGVGVVLVGMRRTSYVRDALGALAWEPIPRWREVYDTLRDGSSD